jgi:prepilin-type N-terminal cleavage/methylation domain-containing protein
VTRLRREDGMTLIEVMLTMVLMLIVLGATLTTFNTFERNARNNQNLNEAQDNARRGLDLMARDLRNLASPTPLLPLAVDVSLPQDLIFQSEGKVKPPGSFNAQNTTRVRYCLNTTTKVLYRQIQTWTTAAAPGVPASACGAAGGWNSTMVVATDVTNAARPIFAYNAVDHDKITEVSAQLFVDTTPNRLPSEVDIQSSVFLRNQNRAPTAIFSATSMPGGGIFLNASESEDPEEKALTFEWWDASESPEKKVGEGIVFTYSPSAAGMRQMYLVVKDATLETTSDTKTVCSIGPGVTCP